MKKTVILKIINELKKLSAVSFCILYSLDSVFVPQTAETVAKKYDINFPIIELGGCTSILECQAFCEDPVNQASCISYAKAKGFYDEKTAQAVTTSLVTAAKKELGCDSEESCKKLCEEDSNFNICTNFAIKYNVTAAITSSTDQANIVEKAKESLGCTSTQSCQNYCSLEENKQKCSQFAKEVGLRAGVSYRGPGGCTSAATCQAFCSDPYNFNSCASFVSSQNPSGSVEFKGPGGCDSESACTSYCQEHPTICSPPAFTTNSLASQNRPISVDAYSQFCRDNPNQCSYEKYCLSNPTQCGTQTYPSVTPAVKTAVLSGDVTQGSDGSWCIDSDGNGGYYTPGSCQDKNGTYTDFCDSTTARDYYCGGNWNGTSWSNRHCETGGLVCSSSGTNCSAGACQSASLSTASVNQTTTTPNSSVNCWGGRYFNGTICVCPTGQTWNGSYCAPMSSSCQPPPSGCGTGSTWSYTQCLCQTAVSTNSTNCTGGTIWSGNACVCPSGSAWNGSMCTTSSGTTTSCQPPSPGCGSNYYWDYSSCLCKSSSTTSTSTQCSGGRFWNGTSCVCATGMTWNGSSCISSTTSTSTPTPTTNSTTSGDGTWCNDNDSNSYYSSGSCQDQTGTYYDYCESGTARDYFCGGTWNGTTWNNRHCQTQGLVCSSMGLNCQGGACLFTTSGSSGSTSTPTPVYTTCSGGRYWSNGSCVCPSGTSWNGSSCVSSGCQPPSSGCGSNYYWDTGSCSCHANQATPTTSPTCSGGQYWNGSSCTCPSGTSWTGSSCTGTSGGTSSCQPPQSGCGSGYWDTSTCSCHTQDPATQCAQTTGCSWSEGTCHCGGTLGISSSGAINFPISELGNCQSCGECSQYCVNPANHTKCLEYVESSGLDKTETENKNDLLSAAESELGCNSEASCQKYCRNESNSDQCLNFARDHQIVSSQDLPNLRPPKIEDIEATLSGQQTLKIQGEQDTFAELYLQPSGAEANLIFVGRRPVNSETGDIDLSIDTKNYPNGDYKLIAKSTKNGRTSLTADVLEIKIENTQNDTAGASQSQLIFPSSFNPQKINADKTMQIEKFENTRDSQNNLVLTMSGKAVPNSIVSLLIYSNPIVVTVKTDANGVWQYNLEKPLDSGKHIAYVAVAQPGGTKIRSEVAQFVIAKTAVAAGPDEGLVLASATTDKYSQQYLLFAFVSIGIGVLGGIIILWYKLSHSSLSVKSFFKKDNPINEP